ncbi:MAG TPA: response regulator [Nitrososphaeraceae archaeon]|jgi:DNA-binding response OmpR family regulator|nr:response regulator [Nitrososphaeraceae archaeon]
MNKTNKTNKRILIVDDEPDLTKLCILSLEHYGYKVDAFNDPQEALSNFRPGSYDLIILDIKMPKMDGFELYQEIKKKDNNVKFCFLTASELYYEEFRKKEFCALDKDLFIRKPIDNEQLANKVNKMINN